MAATGNGYHNQLLPVVQQIELADFAGALSKVSDHLFRLTGERCAAVIDLPQKSALSARHNQTVRLRLVQKSAFHQRIDDAVNRRSRCAEHGCYGVARGRLLLCRHQFQHVQQPIRPPRPHMHLHISPC